MLYLSTSKLLTFIYCSLFVELTSVANKVYSQLLCLHILNDGLMSSGPLQNTTVFELKEVISMNDR